MPAPVDPRIVGHWRLVETRAWDDAGAVQPPPIGPVPLGVATFTPDGRMLAVLSDGRTDLPPATKRDYRSYIGDYTFDGTTLVTRVDGALDPAMRGSDQVRAARFQDGRLILRPPPLLVDGRTVHRELAWQRLVPETA